MLSRIVFVMAVSVWGWSSHHQHTEAAFLASAPKQEEMGPNLKFSPVSTTMECILNLTLQYIVIYTALGICRTVLDFQGVAHKSSQVHAALKHASETMFYAPMVCMLFVGFRMRVLQLTKGTGNPPEYVQIAMRSVAYSILANTLVVLLIPVFSSSEVELEETGEVKTKTDGNPFESPVIAFIFNVLRYLIVLGLYAGVGVVVYGLYVFEPPSSVWEGPVPSVSPAVNCTTILTATFFMIYFLQAVSRTYSQYVGGNTFVGKFEEVMHRAADTLGMAPMLCALFLAARMRALQMDPLHGHPQKWAQNCFYACSVALVVQACIAVVVPLLLNGKVAKGKYEGDMSVDVAEPESMASKAMTAVRFLIMLSLYLGAIAVVCSVFTIQHPEGKELTPPLSPTMQCVLNLSFQYFLIYALLWVFITVEDFMGAAPFLSAAKEAIESAKSTVQFAPMLAVLFIATRMRALQMTDNKGAPQGWVQDGMYLATWSILIQFVMCLVMPLFTGKKFTPDSLDGSTKSEENQVQNYWGAMVVTIVRYSALVALLGGITTVAVGVFTMTPETANGRGSIPLVTDGTLPVDLAPQPPGINDVPGAKGAMENVGETVGTGVNAVDDAGQAVAAPVAEATGA